MFEVIRANLSKIEIEENIKIVYACESGSRAWGFPSADSDYDVRFIYLRPIEWYVTIDEKRDVIERPIQADLDINGWDMKKTLQLLRKSNPPLLEWLGSPIIYTEKSLLTSQLRSFIPAFYSPSMCQHHYLNMARGGYRDYLKNEMLHVKKCFYILRALLALTWIETGMGVVPTEFKIMLDKLITNPQLHSAIMDLIARKRSGLEADQGPRIELITQFIESEILRWASKEIVYQPHINSSDELDSFFRTCLTQA